jgi:O-antigen ligase
VSITGLAFLAAFGGGLALALFRHPIFGLYVYMATFYAHPPSRWWGVGLPDLRWSLLAAAVTLIAMYRLPPDKDRQSWIGTTPAKLIIVFCAWVWIQNAWALESQDHLELSILFTKYIVLYFLIYRLVDSPQRVTWFLIAHLLGSIYFGWLAHGARFSGRLEGVGGPGIDEANALGMVMATAAVIGATMMIAHSDWRRWLAILAMPLILNAMVLTGSRSAFLGLIAGGLAIWYLKPPQARAKFYFFAILGLIGAGSLAHEQFLGRMRTITAAVEDPAEMDTSAESRLVLIAAQWEMAKSHPLGLGHRGTGTLAPLYLDAKYLAASRNDPSTMSRTSHNTLMSVLVEQGVPGAIIFGALLIWMFRTARRIKRFGRDQASSPLLLPAAGVAAALLVMQISGLFVDYLKAEVLIWFVALLASIESMLRSTAPESAAQPRPRGTEPPRRPASGASSRARIARIRP